MKYHIKQSRLAEEFQCIKEKCPSTCCSGWSVVWTGEEVTRLKNSCTRGLSERCTSAFPVIDSYNAVKMDEDELCPFLSDGLCEIHRQLGEEYLSYTCREYPRLTRLTSNEFIRSCKITCYAVMERILHDDDCMEMSISPVNKDITAMITPPERAEQYNRLGVPEEYIWDDRLDIKQALIKGAEHFDIPEQGSVSPLNDAFEEIFGWRLIAPQNEKEYTLSKELLKKYCNNSLRNIIKAAYLEWRITFEYNNILESDAYCAFVFSCAAMIQAAYGAALYTSTEQEFICTVCDIAGVLYSDKGALERIASYLRKNDLNTKEYINYIL